MRRPINKEEKEMLARFPVGTLVMISSNCGEERASLYKPYGWNAAGRAIEVPEDTLGLVVGIWTDKGALLPKIPDGFFEDCIDDLGQHRVVLVEQKLLFVHSGFLKNLPE